MPVPRYARVEPGSPERMRRDLADAAQARAVILVEGVSDKAAVEELAARSGVVLAAERIMVVEMGGATNIGRFVDALGPAGLGLRLAGLCDQAEEPHFRRALARTSFHVCTRDLEDELIRALGIARVEQVIETAGELPSLRRFQRQPAQQGQGTDRQLRRFMGTRSGRKSHYARLIVRALEPGQVPRPLAAVLAYVTA
jgi:hypothetical protein